MPKNKNLINNKLPKNNKLISYKTQLINTKIKPTKVYNNLFNSNNKEIMMISTDFSSTNQIFFSKYKNIRTSITKITQT